MFLVLYGIDMTHENTLQLDSIAFTVRFIIRKHANIFSKVVSKSYVIDDIMKIV
jgi:hypothetical protein